MEEVLSGAPSFCLGNGTVSVAVTVRGGHMTADFDLGGRIVRPYARAPWLPTEVDESLPVLLTHLRGDFFCLPFGPQREGPPHGETANGEWIREQGAVGELRLSMMAEDTKCRVVKSVAIREHETALYLQHTIEGLRGPWSYGSHPVLDFSNLADGQGRVSSSAFRWGSVYHGLFSDPKNQEDQSLLPGGRFESLEKVPMLDGGVADLTRYPAREGFDDLIMIVNESGPSPFAWTACVLDGYVWFCLKDPADFPATLFWISNGGRHSGPWCGLHVKRLGLEEVCSYFCDDVDESRRNLLADEGIPTTRSFDGSPVDLRLIQAVSAVPDEFDIVEHISPSEAGVILLSRSGVEVEVCLNWKFLNDSP